MSQNKKNNALKIINLLLNEGYAAFFVGGCVRDSIMGITPIDFDIATSAQSREIISLALANGWRTVTVGQAFGVVIIDINGCQYEVASFRTDTYGEDSHRPVSVRPVNCIADDLSRRDFTFNAMAMDIDGVLIDPFGGVFDLRRKIVRTVGNPNQRFAEDALRMFRAIRFAARFGFTIEAETFAAISKNLDRVSGLSVERVTTEIEKILLSNHPVLGVRLLLTSRLFVQNCRKKVAKKEFLLDILPELQYFPLDMPEQTSLLSNTPKRIILRWAALLYLIAKGMPKETKAGYCCQIQPKCRNIEKSLVILTRLKIKSSQFKTIGWLLSNYSLLPVNQPHGVRKWLNIISQDFSNCQNIRNNLACLLVFCKAVNKSSPNDLHNLRLLTQSINKTLKNIPFFTGQLAISGKKIANELGFGSQVKQFQLRALANIQKGILKNTPGDLLEMLKHEVTKPTSTG